MDRSLAAWLHHNIDIRPVGRVGLKKGFYVANLSSSSCQDCTVNHCLRTAIMIRMVKVVMIGII